MVLEHQELGYQLLFKNGWCQRQVPRWTKKMGYSSSPSSSTPKSGRWLIISQIVLLGQIFLQLMLMGHFGQFLTVCSVFEYFCYCRHCFDVWKYFFMLFFCPSKCSLAQAQDKRAIMGLIYFLYPFVLIINLYYAQVYFKP